MKCVVKCIHNLYMSCIYVLWIVCIYICIYYELYTYYELNIRVMNCIHICTTDHSFVLSHVQEMDHLCAQLDVLQSLFLASRDTLQTTMDAMEREARVEIEGLRESDSNTNKSIRCALDRQTKCLEEAVTVSWCCIYSKLMYPTCCAFQFSVQCCIYSLIAPNESFDNMRFWFSCNIITITYLIYHISSSLIHLLILWCDQLIITSDAAMEPLSIATPTLGHTVVWAFVKINRWHHINQWLIHRITRWSTLRYSVQFRLMLF